MCFYIFVSHCILLSLMLFSVPTDGNQGLENAVENGK